MASIATGWIGWSGHVLLLPVVMLFPLIWSQAPTRIAAALIAAGYFLAASRGLPQGVANFYSTDRWPGLLLWLAASASFIAVHTMLWTARHGCRRALRYLTALLLMALPPFGIVGWAHPLTAAGVVFPGWGWWGVTALIMGLLTLTTRFWAAAAIVCAGFWLWSSLSWTDALRQDRWVGVDLNLGRNLGREASLERQREMMAMVAAVADKETRVVVLPENALGFWTPTLQLLWQNGLRGTDITVVSGATVVHPTGYDNVIVAITAEDSQIVYRERMPVPGSMWQPWLKWTGLGGGARSDFFANPVVDLAGKRIAPLICYEQLILWPILQSMFQSPDAIVLVGNGWWTDGTSIVDIQRASAVAWARLFGKPLIVSFNS